jgi:hypothetical protein
MGGGTTMRPSPKGYSPNVMGLASLGQRIGIFCDSLYSVLLFNAILGLYLLRRALSRPQVESIPSLQRALAACPRVTNGRLGPPGAVKRPSCFPQ